MQGDRGCMCFDCSRLGSCPYASCKVKSCAKFHRSRVTSAEAAKILDCRTETVCQLKKSNDGRRYIISRFRHKGYDLSIEVGDTYATMYLKEPFKLTAMSRAYPLHDYNRCLAEQV